MNSASDGAAAIRAGSARHREEADLPVVSEPFDAVFDRTRLSLIRLAHLVLNNRAEAEDIVQEAATKLVARNNVNNPDAFLRTVVVNLCRSRIRRRSAARKYAHLVHRREETTAHSEPLLDILDRLPVRQRTAIVLRYYEDRTDDEIGMILGCRPGTVRSLLSRALSTLRDEVQK